jgi:Cd2+/Zn2+-exporting ATPase
MDSHSNSASPAAMAHPERAAPVAEWVERLGAFLRSQGDVKALKVNAATHTAAVASLSEVNLMEIRAELDAILMEIEATRGVSQASSGRLPGGIVFRGDGRELIIQRESCETAPRFWEWREFDWPLQPIGTGAPSTPEWKALAWSAGICGVVGLAGFVAQRSALLPHPWLIALYSIAIAAGGWDAALDTWNNIKKGELDFHFLMLAVAAGAISTGAWSEAALLLFLFSGSGAMEEFALHRTQSEVNALLKSAPKEATLILPGGGERVVPVESVKVGDRLLVHAGEGFAADGQVLKGSSAADESSLTGESHPVDKETGSPVFSGSLNLWGAVEVEVQRLPSESTLQKIIRLIQTAQRLKAPSERFTDKFGGRYTAFVFALGGSMFLYWWLVLGLPAFADAGGTPSAFYRAMTVLVVASPCALVLSIPAAILAAIACGARHGILFRGGGAIEKLAQVGVVALDKTGTLTTGELAVVGCESFPAGQEDTVLELAVALEGKSQHPVARAIQRHGRLKGVRRREVDQFESLTGKGLRGRVDGMVCILGRRELFGAGPWRQFFENTPEVDADFNEVWVISDRIVGRLLLRDEIRKESAATLSRLRSEGIRTVMLTGDRRHAAEQVARQLGIDEVRSGLTPGQKVDAVVELSRSGAKVAMVGDGVNDAPSLAAAFVSVAMGARASDSALEQAEIVLMNDRIENFSFAYDLSMKARQIIRQNLIVSLGTIVVMVVVSIAGAIPLSLGVFAHEGSTVVVCLNGLRLLFFGGNREATG